MASAAYVQARGVGWAGWWYAMTAPVFSGARVLRRFDAERSCGTKHKHASMGKAMAHIRSVRRRFGDDAAAGMVAYRCRFCKAWHVGHGRG